MSSEKYHYEPGAIHNDHHKEVNIGQVPERVLNDLIRNFFKDDAEDAEYEEVTTPEVAQQEVPVAKKDYGTPQTEADFKAIFDKEKKEKEALKEAAQQEYKTWKETECFGGPTLEKLEQYRLRILLELFASGIFDSLVSKMVATEKKDGEINFDVLDEEAECRKAWRNYAALRNFFEYETGVLKHGNTSKLGRLFFTLVDDNRVDKKISALFLFIYRLALIQKRMQELKQLNNERNKTLTDKRRIVLRNIDSFIEKGEWVLPGTEENIKQMIRNVLNVGDYVLEGQDLELSKALWDLFENREGDATAVTWQNIVGYLYSYELLPQSKGSSQLQKMFFGKNDVDKYTNIDKGKITSTQMPAKFKNVLPLLDKYRVKP